MLTSPLSFSAKLSCLGTSCEKMNAISSVTREYEIPAAREILSQFHVLPQLETVSARTSVTGAQYMIPIWMKYHHFEEVGLAAGGIFDTADFEVNTYSATSDRIGQTLLRWTLARMDMDLRNRIREKSRLILRHIRQLRTLLGLLSPATIRRMGPGPGEPKDLKKCYFFLLAHVGYISSLL